MSASELSVNVFCNCYKTKNHSSNFKKRCVFIAVVFHCFVFLLFLCPVVRRQTMYYYKLAVQPSVYSVKIIKFNNNLLNKNNNLLLQNTNTNKANNPFISQEFTNQDNNITNNKVSYDSNNNSPLVNYKIGSYNNPSPIYPQFAIDNLMQGVVELFVTVDYYGKVKTISVSKSSGFNILDDSAKHTVKNWVFEVRQNQVQQNQDNQIQDLKNNSYEVIVPIEFLIK